MDTVLGTWQEANSNDAYEGGDIWTQVYNSVVEWTGCLHRWRIMVLDFNSPIAVVERGGSLNLIYNLFSRNVETWI